MDMLNDGAGLLAKCVDKREKVLVSDFFALWEERKFSLLGMHLALMDICNCA